MVSQGSSNPTSSAARRPTTLGLGALLALLGAAFVTPIGCLLDSQGTLEPTGSGGSGSTGTSSSTGGSGGCSSPAECSDNNPCTEDLCTAGKCSNPPNDNAVPSDGKPCTTDSCVAGAEKHDPVAAGVACGQGQGMKCDGMGTCVGCAVDGDCEPPAEPCMKAVCNPDQTCGRAPQPMNTKLPDAQVGDCKGSICDGQGKATEVEDPSDVPLDDLNTCTEEQCQGGMPVHAAKPVGTQCADSATFCNAMSQCVECVGNANCLGGYCFDEACASCSNGVKEGVETDADCGGVDCPKCADGKTCLADGDCMSGDCAGGVCISCNDAKKNGSETDVDCGGNSCAKCGGGKICLTGNDCVAGTCTNGVCVVCTTNGVKDGSETGIDCGGGCGPCPQGQGCGGAADCTNGTCVDGVCCENACAGACKTCNYPGKEGKCTNAVMGNEDTSGPATCSGAMICSCTAPINNKICDQSGTPSCVADNNKKAFGEPCLNLGDCFNGACRNGACRNNIGDICSKDADCWTLRCESGICQTTCAGNGNCASGSCSGGTCLQKPGSPCLANADCISNVCTAFKTCQ